MALKVGFQMDPIESVDIDVDSTFRIALESQQRGHEVLCYLPEGLSYEGGDVSARCRPVTLRQLHGNHVDLGLEQVLAIREFDVIWLRQDPPFDMSYITTTHLLDLVRDETLVVNDPFWVRNFPEKLLVLNFPELIPPSVISRDFEVLSAFRDAHGDIVMKPLYGNGGAGVFLIRRDDMNFNSLYEMFMNSSREPVIAQKYLEDVRSGDKRVILVDGRPVGAINRIPAAGEARSNLHVGGTAVQVGLSQRDIEICEAIGPHLSENGQIFAGIDIIGDWLTEINITSPTGIVELEAFDGTNVASMIWDAIDESLRQRQGRRKRQ